MLKLPRIENSELEGEIMSRTLPASGRVNERNKDDESSGFARLTPTRENEKENFAPQQKSVSKNETINSYTSEQSKNNSSSSVGVSLANPQNTSHPEKLSFLKKISKIKNIQIYIAAAVILIMILIYASTFMGGSGNSSSSANNNRDQVVANANAFAREMEHNLVRVLSSVNGVGNVNVMLTVIGSPTLEIAYNVEERTVTQTGQNGQTTTTTTIVKTPILVGGNPIVIQQLKPRLLGVIVVAQGAQDIWIRMNIERAVRAVVADASVNIEILAG